METLFNHSYICGKSKNKLFLKLATKYDVSKKGSIKQICKRVVRKLGENTKVSEKFIKKELLNLKKFPIFLNLIKELKILENLKEKI